MTVANLFVSSVYSHKGCYKSALLLTATKYVRNGAVITQEVFVRGCFESEVQLSEYQGSKRFTYNDRCFVTLGQSETKDLGSTFIV